MITMTHFRLLGALNRIFVDIMNKTKLLFLSAKMFQQKHWKKSIAMSQLITEITKYKRPIPKER